jgi:signal recognition particle subunit SRP54
MTPIERSKPALIDVKKGKNCKGSGTKIEQVNQLMKQFDQMSNDENDAARRKTS